MSLILDALKRADRERKLEKAPDLSAIYQEENTGGRNYRPWIWTVGILVCAAVAAAALLWPEDADKIAAKSQKPKTVQVAARSKTTSPPKKAPAVSKTTETAASDVSASSKPGTARPKQNETQKEQTKAPETVQPEPAAPPKSVEDPDVTIKIEEEQPAVTPPPLKEEILTETPPPEPIQKPAISKKRADRSKSPLKNIPNQVKQKNTYPLFEDLPEDVQGASGPLEINVHMYSPKPSERRVFINMKGYREGDAIGESGFKLVEITSDGVVIDTGKGKAFLGVSRK
jgi:general secretion pathway protein B